MKNDKRLAFVRTVLWAGAIADFGCVLQYCLYMVTLERFGIDQPVPPIVRFILIHAAALMAAWTLLLVWTARNPIERRTVILLTVPIVLCITVSYGYLVVTGAIPTAVLGLIAIPATLTGLFLAAYLTACRINRSSATAP